MTGLITAARLRHHLACPHRNVLEPGCTCTPAQHEREAATRRSLVAREAVIEEPRLSTFTLCSRPLRLRREGNGYVAVERMMDAAGPAAADGIALALHTHVLEQMGLAAGRHGYLWHPQGSEVRCELGQPPGPGQECLWGQYLQARRAVYEVLSVPQHSRPVPCAACATCPWHAHCLAQFSCRGRFA